MNRLPLIFLGIFLVFASAWVGLLVVPYFQFGQLDRITDEITGETFPPSFSGKAQIGQQVYMANGCIYCHSQQIRPDTFGSDIKRGWGIRRTVARDYIDDKTVLLGTMRTGPDLTNIGRRQPSRQWHHLHLYDPQTEVPGSTMPPSRFLYRKQKIGFRPSSNALPIKGVEEGYEIVPTEDAENLVTYLLSLDKSYPLPEAPID